jgi:hypothetical protein
MDAGEIFTVDYVISDPANAEYGYYKRLMFSILFIAFLGGILILFGVIFVRYNKLPPAQKPRNRATRVRY